jgi:spore coat polysaccharide biosynthesis protein SpsF
MKVVASVSCRMSSRRLPGKNARQIAGKPMLARLLERLKHSREVSEVVVATTTEDDDTPLVEIARAEDVAWHRGSLDDVMGRVVGAARQCGADLVVEITGDCPLSDPAIVDAAIRRYNAGGFDYVANVLDALTFPAGFDVQVFSRDSLERAASLTSRREDREDVTRYFYEHPDAYRLLNLRAPAEVNRPSYWLCVDNADDFMLVSRIFETLLPVSPVFGARDVIELLDADPVLATSNVCRSGLFTYPQSGGRSTQVQLALAEMERAR